MSWNVWVQKISILPPRRELEIPRGWGQRPRKFWRGGVAEWSIWFPDALRFNMDFSINLQCSCSKIIYQITFEMNFLSSKSTLDANKCKERAVTWKWPPLLVTSLHGTHHVDRKALVTSLVCFCIALVSCRVAVAFPCENEFLCKVEMLLRFHKFENFLFLFISVHLFVILL